MDRPFILIALLSLTACTTAGVSEAVDNTAPPSYAGSDRELATHILKDSIGYATVEGRGNVPALAEYYAGVLRNAGFADDDIVISPYKQTATLAATLHGRTDEKPVLVIGHMDVVEANPADWERDPFTAIEEDGYIFGRGSLDNKFAIAMQIAALARLKRENYVPRQDVILLLSGDEETSQESTAVLAKQYKHAALALNGDAGGGAVDNNGKALYYTMQAGEKSYADFKLEFTSPGGHSSRPAEPTAITRLANALAKIGAYYFEPEHSDLTVAALRGVASQVDKELGDAMRRFANDPGDLEAVNTIRKNPAYIGQIGTTCVATTIEAGHAVNALPQRATANINCRIFPGIPASHVRDELVRVIDDATGVMTISWDPLVVGASPLTNEIIGAVNKAVRLNHPDVPIFPGMSAGTTDSILFRAQGVPSYGTSGLFMRTEDMFAHGLNERVPTAAIPNALSHWDSLLRTITR